MPEFDKHKSELVVATLNSVNAALFNIYFNKDLLSEEAREFLASRLTLMSELLTLDNQPSS